MTLSAASPPSRVQRLVGELPPVHLEAAIPPADPAWILRVEGMVRRPLELSLAELRGLGAEEVVMDHHCVWGWSRRACRWTGVRLGRLLDLAGPRESAGYVTVACRVPPYAACLSIADAREGILAWELDGSAIAPENGGPLRFQNPPWLWGYKGVKWAGALTLGDRFSPGFWEAMVADPAGRVPEEVLLPFHPPEDVS
jgi:DMSO/TMAO reductase YedYZ molybdopterin-dependent catalytic subunit